MADQPVPEQVYLDAARAALGAPPDFDSPTLHGRARRDWHRRTVESAYRAGQAAEPGRLAAPERDVIEAAKKLHAAMMRSGAEAEVDDAIGSVVIAVDVLTVSTPTDGDSRHVDPW